MSAPGAAAEAALGARPARERDMRRVLPWWYRSWCELRWALAPRSLWRARIAEHHWLFVLGVNRSGKTTLANLLAHHPLVSVVPNASNMSRALPTSISEGCPHVFAEKLGRFRLTEEDVGRANAARLLFDWLTFRPRPRPFILIESDLASVQMRWLQALLPRCSFVAMVRSAYAVAEGIRRKEGYDIARCARAWARANLAMLEDAARVRRFRLVRYEDFVADPRRMIEEITHFVDLDPAPLYPLLRTGWRLSNTDAAPSQLRDANPELIAGLSADEREAVRASAAAMLDRLGYGATGAARAPLA